MPLRRLPPLHAIRAFEAAARHLSVTRAAEELAVTPGAVSRHARPRPEDWRRWLDHARLGAVPVQGGASFESIGLAIEAAAAGLGFAIAIESLLGPDLTRGAVVVAHRTVRPTRRWFVLQYDQRLAGDPALLAFTAWLRGEAGEGGAAPA